MGKSAKSVIDTFAKRARLAARKNPYWQSVGGGRGGVSLGYRKGSRGGVWVAKVVVTGQRLEERIGPADDLGAEAGALPFPAAVSAALEWSRQQSSALEARRAAPTAAVVTVRSAVEAYSSARTERSVRSGKNAQGRLVRYVLSDPEIADVRLAKLRSSMLEAWRRRLPSELAPHTVNRIQNDFRAALNSAAQRHRRELPATVLGEIRAGTRPAAASAIARQQLLTDDQIRKIIEAAYSADPAGDFGHLILLSAATGARFSQLAALKVGALQLARKRVMISASAKGRRSKIKPPTAVPLGADAIDRLKALSDGRDVDEPLLSRWSYRRVPALPGSKSRLPIWEKHVRRAWSAAYETKKAWSAAVTAAGLPPDTIMYALRHSSIVRGLRANLPVRLVAALHDTSIEMIEAHYSVHIVDMSEDLARRALMTLANPATAER